MSGVKNPVTLVLGLAVAVILFAVVPAPAQNYQIAITPSRSVPGLKSPASAQPAGKPEEAGIVVVNSDGSGRHLLVAERMAILRPNSWSPDGRTVLYNSFGPDDAGMKMLPMHLPLYAVDADGRNRRRIVDFAVYEFGWSPDGRYLFLTSGFEDATFAPAPEKSPKLALYVLDTQTGTRTRLTDSGEVAVGVSWAPDGKRLAYAGQGREDTKPDIFIVNRDGSGTRRLVNLPGANLNPRWSPDGKSLLFVSTPRGSEGRGIGFYVVDAESAALIFVADFAGWPGMQWTPDGRRVLVGASDSGMVLGSADGKTRTTLTDIGLDPVFSPDGSELYFRMRPPDGSIWAIRVGDMVRRKVVDNGVSFCLSPLMKK